MDSWHGQAIVEGDAGGQRERGVCHLAKGRRHVLLQEDRCDGKEEETCELVKVRHCRTIAAHDVELHGGAPIPGFRELDSEDYCQSIITYLHFLFNPFYTSQDCKMCIASGVSHMRLALRGVVAEDRKGQRGAAGATESMDRPFKSQSHRHPEPNILLHVSEAAHVRWNDFITAFRKEKGGMPA